LIGLSLAFHLLVMHGGAMVRLFWNCPDTVSVQQHLGPMRKHAAASQYSVCLAAQSGFGVMHACIWARLAMFCVARGFSCRAMRSSHLICRQHRACLLLVTCPANMQQALQQAAAFK
jgi:hypothetical protein